MVSSLPNAWIIPPLSSPRNVNNPTPIETLPHTIQYMKFLMSYPTYTTQSWYSCINTCRVRNFVQFAPSACGPVFSGGTYVVHQHSMSAPSSPKSRNNLAIY